MRLQEFVELFRSSRPSSAAVAKERLQIIVAHERRRAPSPDFLQLLQRDILEVVRRYVRIAEDQIRLSVDRNGEYEVLELNIALPDAVPRL
ncbi:MAG: cell division topological specificity factor MinE [Candidatus Latescibacterota bacterium]